MTEILGYKDCCLHPLFLFYAEPGEVYTRHFYPIALEGCRGTVLCPDWPACGRVGSKKKLVQAVSQKLYGLGCCYSVGTLIWGCRCATSWCDLDLTLPQ